MKSSGGIRIPAVIFVTALAARILFYFAFKKIHPDFWTESAVHINGWLEIAENLVSGHGYSENSLLTYFPSSHPAATASRGPVPVFFLSLLLLIFKGHYFPALFIQSWVLSSASAVLLYSLCKKIFAAERPALVTALLYCFYLPEMYISTSYAAASESLFALILLIYFHVFIRGLEVPSAKNAVLAGLLLGLAFLCRPVILFFPIFYAAWMLKVHRAKGVSLIICFFSAFIITAAPWAVRNQIVFGRPVITTTLGGYNLLRHNVMIRDNQFKILTRHDFQPIALQAIAENGKSIANLNEVQADEIFKTEARKIIRAYPLRYLKLCAMRLGWLWYKIDGERPLFLFQNLLIYFFMLPGLFFVLPRHRLLCLFSIHWFYFIAIHIFINAQFRFLVPFMPYGIMIAVYTAGAFFAWCQRSVSHSKLSLL